MRLARFLTVSLRITAISATFAAGTGPGVQAQTTLQSPTQSAPTQSAPTRSACPTGTSLCAGPNGSACQGAGYLCFDGLVCAARELACIGPAGKQCFDPQAARCKGGRVTALSIGDCNGVPYHLYRQRCVDGRIESRYPPQTTRP